MVGLDWTGLEALSSPISYLAPFFFRQERFRKTSSKTSATDGLGLSFFLHATILFFPLFDISALVFLIERNWLGIYKKDDITYVYVL